jgi:hypothetical protein
MGNVGEVEIVRKPAQQRMAAMAAADRRRSRGWGCLRRGGRPDGGERESAATGMGDVSRGRQPAFAIDEVDIHEIVGVTGRGQIGQPEFVADLMRPGGEQVEVAGRCAGRIGGQVGAGGIGGVGARVCRTRSEPSRARMPVASG